MNLAARTRVSPALHSPEGAKAPQRPAAHASSDAPPSSTSAAQHMPGPATQSPDTAHAQPAAEPRRALLLLRVLSGPQQGAQVPMRHHRLLIGNLASECDVVLDLGGEQPHVCMVRASRDGWTAMAVSGDLWLDETWASPQQAQEIFSGTVLTLGQVSFCIADGATMDWETVRVPENLQRPHAMKAPATEEASERGWLARWPWAQSLLAPLAKVFQRCKPRRRNKLLLAMLLALGLGMAGVGAVLIITSAHSVPSLLPRPDDVISQARGALAALPGATELTLSALPQRPHAVSVGGWLRQRGDGAAVEAALRKLGLEPEARWKAVDGLQKELDVRFATLQSSTGSAWRYGGQGTFVLTVLPAELAAADMPARQALQQLDGLRSLGFEPAATGRSLPRSGSEPVLVRYQRDGSQVNVSGLDRWPVAQQPARYGVLELRLTGLRSVVLENGARYFEGATLPDGAVLTRILADRLQLKDGERSRDAAIELRVQPLSQVPPNP